MEYRSDRRKGVQVMPRPTILTQAALARVASLVEQGRSAAEIADEMGCTLGTLRVRCSQLGISLRRRAANGSEKLVAAIDFASCGQAQAATQCKSVERAYPVGQCRAVVGESPSEGRTELTVLLPQITTEQLRQRAALRGISGSTLAAELLVTIARDGLYDAVLDGS
jgi:DNA-binding CsgD family transcriptional regulator